MTRRLSPCTTRPTRLAARSLFERALDALPDGVLLIDGARRVIYANAAFARLWNIPPALIAAKDEARMLEFASGQLIDPGGFHREVERIHPTDETSDDEVYFKDGRILSRRSVPFQQDGELQARIWIFTDVTEARNARIDALSGLPNRRAYASDFPKFAAAPDDGLVKSVAIMDLDNFKAYNDRYGHAAGDMVLRQIGVLLRERLRQADDLVFRIGGEEFLMACKTRREGDALAFFESVRRSVMALGIEHADNRPYGVVTASFGLDVFRGPADPVAAFGEADAALYRAKAAGRNAVRSAAPVPA